MKHLLRLLVVLLFVSLNSFAVENGADSAAVAAKEAEDIQKQAEMMVKQLESIHGLPPVEERVAPVATAAQPAPTPQQAVVPPCNMGVIGLTVQGGSMSLVQQRAAQLVTDEKFMNAVKAVASNPNRSKVVWANIAFFLFMGILQIVHNSKREEDMFKRMLHAVAFKMITWAGVIYAIPVFLLGQPYAVLFNALKQFFFG